MRMTTRTMAAGAAVLIGALAACGGTVDEGETGGGSATAGSGPGVTTTVTATTGMGGTGAGGTGTQTGTQTGGTGGCNYPTAPATCADATYFECGFMASCEDGIIRADWHVHMEMECGEIVDLSCEYECPYGCAGGEYQDWPQDGAQLVEDLCAPVLSGTGGAAGSGGAGGT
jgi:hypothetical protein